MRIVITGGCGFLGRRLALLLLETGSALGAIDELVLFDNAPSALPLKPIRAAVREPAAAAVRGAVS